METIEHRCLVVVGRGPLWARGFVGRCDTCREARRPSKHVGLVQFTVWFVLAASLPVLPFVYFALLGVPLGTVKQVGETQIAALGVGTVLEVVVALGIAAAISFRGLNARLEAYARRGADSGDSPGVEPGGLLLVDRQNMALFFVSVLLAGVSLLTGVLGRSLAALVLAGIVAAALGVEMIGIRPRVRELEALDRARLVRRSTVIRERKQRLRQSGVSRTKVTVIGAAVAALAPVCTAFLLAQSVDRAPLIALIGAGLYSGLVPFVLGLMTLDMANRSLAASGTAIAIVAISLVPLLVSPSALPVTIFAFCGVALASGGAGIGPLKGLARMYLLFRDRRERKRYEIQLPAPAVSGGDANAATVDALRRREENVPPAGWAERRQMALSTRSTTSRTASMRGPSTP